MTQQEPKEGRFSVAIPIRKLSPILILKIDQRELISTCDRVSVAPDCSNCFENIKPVFAVYLKWILQFRYSKLCT